MLSCLMLCARVSRRAGEMAESFACAQRSPSVPPHRLLPDKRLSTDARCHPRDPAFRGLGAAGQGSFQISPDDFCAPQFEDLRFRQTGRWVPDALLLVVTCVDAEHGVSLPVPGTSPPPFLGCDYLCLVSPSIPKNPCFLSSRNSLAFLVQSWYPFWGYALLF